MLDALYRRRLERDLEVWRDRGLVTSAAADAILESISQDGRPRTAIVVGFLGAVLIAFAAIAFVASNWADMARPVRLALLVGGMAFCYGLAALLDRARHPWFADAAIFAGAALFGAAIMLVAQSYHISGDYPDALLMWGAGAFLAAVLGPSRASLALALLVLSLWSWYSVTEFGWIVHWPFLLALAALAMVVGAWAWRAGIHLVVLALAGWIAVSLVSLGSTRDWSEAAGICFAASVCLLLFALGRFVRARFAWTRAAPFGPVVSIYGLIGFLGLLLALQFAIVERGLLGLDHDRGPLIGAAIAIAIAAGLLVVARPERRMLVFDAVVPVAIAAAALILTVLAARDSQFAGSLAMQVLLGALALVAGLWAVAHGNRHHSRASAVFGLITFAAEVLYLYFVTFGTLIDTALFFLIGGVLLIALAAALVRLQRRLLPPGSAEAA